VSVLTVEAFLEAINPSVISPTTYEAEQYALHGFPVEITFVRDASPMRQFGKVYLVRQFFQTFEEIFEAGRISRQGYK
jgi:hypothetical protein